MKESMLLIALLWGVVAQPPNPALIDQPDENTIISVVLRDPWLTQFGREYVVVERRTAIPWLTPWLREKPLQFAYEREGSDEMAMAPVDLLEAARQRNKHAISIAASALPPDGKWCGDSQESLRSCIILSRPGINSDGTKAVVAVLAPNLSGWSVYLENRNGRWQIVGRGFLYVAG